MEIVMGQRCSIWMGYEWISWTITVSVKKSYVGCSFSYTAWLYLL